MPIRLTRTIKVLLIASFVVFLIQQTGDQFFGTRILLWFGLVPSSVFEDHAYWQLLTYSFLNRDIMQLFFNLMMLAFIGSELEVVWGASRFLKYYFFCATASALSYLILQVAFFRGMGINTPLIGASGAIYGLLTAYGIIFGERVLLFMMLFPMKAKYFVWVLGLIELLTTFYSSGGAPTSIALLGGMVGGFLYLIIQANLIRWAKKTGDGGGIFSKRMKKRRSNHLKLVVNNDRELNSPDDDESEGGKPKTWH